MILLLLLLLLLTETLTGDSRLNLLAEALGVVTLLTSLTTGFYPANLAGENLKVSSLSRFSNSSLRDRIFCLRERMLAILGLRVFMVYY